MTPGSDGSVDAGRHIEVQPAPAIEKGFLVAGVDDPAAIDEGDLIGDLLDVLRVVRREENRAALVAHDVHQLGEDLVPRDRIEAGGRLVEERAGADDGRARAAAWP